VLKLALFGHPVGHSRSPEVHAAFGAQCGIALDYALVDVPDLDLAAALTRFIAAGGRGANLTLPFKRDGHALCATLGPEARSAGAVNTVVVEADGRLRGEDTDGLGLLRDLATHHGVALAGARVALLGASGAARGIAAALLGAGVATLTVADRNPTRGAAFERAFRDTTVGGYAALAGGAFDLVINATSASLRGELPPLPAAVLRRGGVAYDAVYAAAPTRFVAWAEAAGAGLALDGWGMLIEQAALSFALWTGRIPDPAPLRQRR